MEDGGREQGVVLEAHKHANTQFSLWMIWNVEKYCKAACCIASLLDFFG